MFLESKNDMKIWCI